MSILQSKNKQVVVLGEVMIELSGITDTQATIGVAGDTFNTAVYLSRQGVDVSYATALGQDQFSDRIRAGLIGEHIDTGFVLSLPDMNPGIYAINLDEYGERSFDYWRGQSAARRFFEAQGCDDAIASMSSAGLLYLSGITLSVLNSHISELVQLVVKVRENGGEVVFDTNYRPSGWSSHEQALSVISSIAPYVSIALPTLEDDCELFGLKDEVECADKWRSFGAKEIVVKGGGKGAYLPDVGWIKPPEVIKPKDTTGAGDSFNGGYLGALILGKAPEEAVMIAHQLAAKVLMTAGAILPKQDGL
jgi:2-dehydro-3-deoxygluconokinase